MRPTAESQTRLRANSSSAIVAISLVGSLAWFACESAPYGEILGGKACDEENRCAEGYECDRALDRCVPAGTLTGGGGAGPGGAPEGGGGQTSAGGGGEGPCNSVGDCQPATRACETAVCLGGTCGVIPITSETPAPISQQTEGDCKLIICDGLGGVILSIDDSDFVSDGNDCTEDRCNNGTPENRAMVVGSACGIGAASFCDEIGTCVECLSVADCTDLPPGDDCQQPQCNSGLCELGFVPPGTAVPAQITGDCVQLECDGAGVKVIDEADTDVPDDGNDCTTDSCDAGAPVATPVGQGTACAAGACDAIGQCVGCTLPSDCSGMDSFCRQRTCVASVCGFTFTPSGAALPAAQQIDGDCRDLACDGAGGLQLLENNADVPPADGTACTTEACVGGSAQYPPTPFDSLCADDDGIVCDGSGSCVECNDGDQCVNQGSVCQDATCQLHACGVANKPSGAAAKAAAQTPGDCKVVRCDGSGGTQTPATDNADLPSDGNECTLDQCASGTPSFPPAPAGSACGGGGICDGAGNCTGADKPLGDPCVNDGECDSNHCTDGVCCESTCGGLCAACVASATGMPDGQCDSITAGQDPEAECGGFETCDGSGQCAFTCAQQPTPPATMCPAACTGGCADGTCIVSCAGTSCAGAAIVCPANLACRVECPQGADCSASMIACPPDLYACEVACSGNCQNASIACGSGTCSLACGNGNGCQGTDLLCGENACSATCNGSQQFPSVACGPSCDCTTCALPNGSACANTSQCASGFCPAQDDVCCDQACAGACQGCVAAKTGGVDGTCAPVTSGTEPDQDCAGPAICVAGNCQLAANGATCSNANQCASGFCPAQDGVCCDEACGGTCKSCRMTNTGFADGDCQPITIGIDPSNECAGASTCNGAGGCSGLPNGAACNAGNQCSSGNCPTGDGVCCDTSCVGACRSCRAVDTPSPNGVCDFVDAGIDPGNDCPGPATCGAAGVCN